MADSPKKIGLIGGTFDPVHNGHLHLALQAQKLFDLQKVIFVPAYRSPHKLDLEPVSCEHRLTMLTLALENQPSFYLDKLEINKNNVSYTIETLNPGCRCFPGNRHMEAIFTTSRFLFYFGGNATRS